MKRFVRYALVGAVATAAHYVLLAMVVEWLHWAAWLGSGLGAVLGAQVAFFGNRVFTFAHEGPVLPAWAKFMGTAAAGALLGMLIVGGTVNLGLHYLLGQVLATLARRVLTFLINRAWTFRHAQGRTP
jgi:putative flippase GtrA